MLAAVAPVGPSLVAMTEPFTPSTDELLANNAEYANVAHDPDLEVAPSRNLAVVACMDARMDVLRILGLQNGEGHIIRNAGGVITDDVIRSLCISQRALGTREIVLVHHTDCGMSKVDEAAFRSELAEELGVKPPWSLEGFADVDQDVRQSIRRLQLTPFLLHKDHVRGFVYEVETGRLREVTG